MLEHFDEFAKELDWDPSFLLHIGMDGPNANLKFQKDLKKHFEETRQETLFLILTPVPSTKSTRLLSVKMLPIYIDQFAVDLHGFYKLSSARREDYSNLQDLTEVASQYVLRH